MDENPFEEDEDRETLMTCWRDGNRACSEECIAYEDRVEVDPRFNPCMLLNLKRAQNASLAKLATEIKRYNDWRAEGKITIGGNDRATAQTEIEPPEIKT